jgi:hypothetical protein
MPLTKFKVTLPGGKTKFSRGGVDYDIRTLDDATAERLFAEGCTVISQIQPPQEKTGK